MKLPSLEDLLPYHPRLVSRFTHHNNHGQLSRVSWTPSLFVLGNGGKGGGNAFQLQRRPPSGELELGCPIGPSGGGGVSARISSSCSKVVSVSLELGAGGRPGHHHYPAKHLLGTELGIHSRPGSSKRILINSNKASVRIYNMS